MMSSPFTGPHAENKDVVHFVLGATSVVVCVSLKHRSFTRSSSAWRRAESTSRHPAFANSYARNSPIPLDAPVIHTTWPFNESEMFTIIAVVAVLLVFVQNCSEQMSTCRWSKDDFETINTENVELYVVYYTLTY